MFRSVRGLFILGVALAVLGSGAADHEAQALKLNLRRFLKKPSILRKSPGKRYRQYKKKRERSKRETRLIRSARDLTVRRVPFSRKLGQTTVPEQVVQSLEPLANLLLKERPQNWDLVYSIVRQGKSRAVVLSYRIFGKNNRKRKVGAFGRGTVHEIAATITTRSQEGFAVLDATISPKLAEEYPELEQEFWDRLKPIADRKERTVPLRVEATQQHFAFVAETQNDAAVYRLESENEPIEPRRRKKRRTGREIRWARKVRSVRELPLARKLEQTTVPEQVVQNLKPLANMLLKERPQNWDLVYSIVRKEKSQSVVLSYRIFGKNNRKKKVGAFGRGTVHEILATITTRSQNGLAHMDATISPSIAKEFPDLAQQLWDQLKPIADNEKRKMPLLIEATEQHFAFVAETQNDAAVYRPE